MKKLILLLLIVLPSTSFALPGVKSWTACWDTNSEEDAAGYYLYWRNPNGTFTDANKVMCDHIASSTKTCHILTGYVPNNSEIAVTCFDLSGNESGFSEILPFVKDSSAPGGPSGLVIEPLQ